MSKSNSYSVPALDKAIDIIELLGRAPDALTLSAIAAALARSPSEIFRVLKTLEKRGYLAREPGDRYLLTNRLFEQGLRRPTTASLLEVAYPEMRALSDRIGQTCHISVPSGDVMVTVARVENARSPSFVVPIGFSLPMTSSASGRVFLAFLPMEEQKSWVGRLRGSARENLRRSLAAIRERGFELAPSATVTGMTDISFPLFEADGRPAAFLAAPFASRRSEPSALKTAIFAMREAAERIDAGLARLRP